MRYFPLLALALTAAIPASGIAQTAPAPAAATAAVSGYNVEDTELGTLLDDPAAKAILVKHLPTLTANPQIDMARSMSLKTLQQYAGDTVTDKALADIQTDLSKLSAKK